MPPVFIPAFYYIFIKIFSFPLASNKAHEFILITRPEKIIIKKIKSRYYQFFEFKKGLYWFGTPCNDIDNMNKYHVFIEGLNQDVTDAERKDGKMGNIIETKLSVKQLQNHQILLPKRIKEHLNRHYTLTIDPLHKICQIAPTNTPQPFKINMYHTLGIYLQEQQIAEEVESGSASGEKILLNAITTEQVLKQIKHIQSYSYFSSSSAFSLYQSIRKIDTNFITWVKGAADPKLLAAVIILAAGGALAVLAMYMLRPDIGPMPTN